MDFPRKGLSALLTTSTLALTLLVGTVTAAKTVNLRIPVDEESSPGTVVANMVTVFDLSYDERAGRSFKLISQKFRHATGLRKSVADASDHLVDLDKRTGRITLNQRVDRDAECNGLDECVISVQAVMMPQSVFTMLQLEIVINDINDNDPIFRAKPEVVNVSESVPVGSRIDINQYLAHDADSGNNSALTYSLSTNDYFAVAQGVDEAGRPHLQLIVQRPLDHETTALHRLRLTATDHGNPARTGRVALYVRVADANDNPPAFDDQEYVAVVGENLAPGSVITTVRATDADTGPRNGAVRYRLVDDGDQGLVTVGAMDGVVRLKAALDREIHDGIRILIEARDQGATRQLSARATLVLHVEDVNDNAPAININFIVDRDTKDESTAYISESAPIGTYVAYVSVTDVDQGSNGQVTTTIASYPGGESDGDGAAGSTGHFTLAEDGLIGTGRALDREARSKYRIAVTACDNGIPARCTARNVTIVVLDENEFAPEFEQPVYDVTLPEDAETGTYVATARAADADAGNAPALWKGKDGKIGASRNGQVFYSLSADAKSTFSIDKIGRIMLIGGLDYEGRKHWQVTVTATDGGFPAPRDAECVLRVAVTDVNDNRPIFVRPARDNMTARATIKSDDVIAQIETMDYDVDSNKKVAIQLLSVDGFRHDDAAAGGVRPYARFIFDARSRELRLNMSGGDLRARLGRHVLVFRAIDFGSPSLHTEISLIVEVVDYVLTPAMRFAPEPSPHDGADDHRPAPQPAGALFLPTPILIAIGGAVLTIVFVAIAIACCVTRCRRKKKNNQGMRTYNCRDAESKNGYGEAPATQSLPGKLASRETLDRNSKNERRDDDATTDIAMQQFKPIRHSSDSEAIRCSASDVTMTSSRHEVIDAISDRPPTAVSSYSCEGKNAQASIRRPLLTSATHTDGDSGRGDSDPDATSYDILADRDCLKMCGGFVTSSATHHTKPTSSEYGSLGSRCTEECDRFGHSDRCWMPSPVPGARSVSEHDNLPAFPPADSAQHAEYNRVLETIQESQAAGYASPGSPHLTGGRKNFYFAPFAHTAAQHLATANNPIIVPPRDYVDKSLPLSAFPHHQRHSLSPSPAPSSAASRHSVSSCPSTTSSSRKDGSAADTLRRTREQYMSVAAPATAPLLRDYAPPNLSCAVSMRETQEIVSDIEKLLY